MRRLITSVALIALIASYFAFSLIPAAAQGQICYLFEAGLTNNQGVTDTATIFLFDTGTASPLTATSSITLNPGQSGVLRLAAFIDASISVGLGGGPSGLTVDSLFAGPSDDSACSGGVAKINDGRVNAYDLGAPLAAYCADGGLAVWDIDAKGQGTLGFTATKQQIADAIASAQSSGQNQLIGEGLGNSLYALTTGELSLIGPDVKEPGKTYSFVTAGKVCG